MPLFGPPNVELLRRRRDVKALVKALGYEKDAGVRKAAAQALGEIADLTAVQPLIAALEDLDAQVRLAAVEALGRQRDARATEPLAALLQRGVTEMRRAAAEALGQTGQAGAIPPLLGALRDPERAIRRAAAGALDLLGWEPDGGEDGATYWAVKGRWDRCAAVGAAATGPLTGVLEDPYLDAGTYRAAVEALGETGAPEAVEPLLDALARFEPQVRAAAAAALGRLGDARAIGPLAVAVTNPGPEVAQAAAQALEVLGWQPDRSEAGAAYWIAKQEWQEAAEIGAPAVAPLLHALTGRGKDAGPARSALVQIGAPAVEPLLSLLAKEDSRTGEVVAKVLQEIGTPAVGPLIAALEDGRPKVRLGAASALRQIADPQAAQPLLRATRDTDVEVAHAAAGALAALGSGAIGPLEEALASGGGALRRDAALALERLGWVPGSAEAEAWYRMARGEWTTCAKLGAPAVVPLVTILEDSDPYVRRQAAGALGLIGDGRAREPLLTLLGDPDRAVRQAAAAALSAMSLPEEATARVTGAVRASAVERLLADLQSWRPREREEAAEALVRMGDGGAVAPLIGLLEHRDREVSRVAAGVLARTGDGSAVVPLIGLLEHRDRAVSKAAAEVLVKLYRSGKLDGAQADLVLSNRSRVTHHSDTGGHQDESHHSDLMGDGTCASWHHNDRMAPHTDEGAGVDFPL